MKTGFNLLLWTTHVTAEHTAILKGIKKAGYDTVEIPVFEGTPEHFARLGELLDKLGFERSVVSVIGPSGKNPLSPDKAARAAAVDYTEWVIDCTKALGAHMIVGPMHSEIGYFSGDGPTASEIKQVRLAFSNVRSKWSTASRCRCTRARTQRLRSLPDNQDQS